MLLSILQGSIDHPPAPLELQQWAQTAISQVHSLPPVHYWRLSQEKAIDGSLMCDNSQLPPPPPALFPPHAPPAPPTGASAPPGGVPGRQGLLILPRPSPLIRIGLKQKDDTPTRGRARGRGRPPGPGRGKNRERGNTSAPSARPSSATSEHDPSEGDAPPGALDGDEEERSCCPPHVKAWATRQRDMYLVKGKEVARAQWQTFTRQIDNPSMSSSDKKAPKLLDYLMPEIFVFWDPPMFWPK